MKTKLANAIDNIFMILAITIFLYVWSKNIIKVGYISIIISIILGLAISKILIDSRKSKNEKILLSEKERRETQKLMQFFLMQSETDTKDFFKKIFEKSFHCIDHESHIEVQTKSSKIFVFWNFKCETTRIEDLANCEKLTLTSASQSHGGEKSKMTKDTKSKLSEKTTSSAKDSEPKSKIYFFSHSFSERAFFYGESKTNFLLFDDSSTYTIAKKLSALPDLSETKIESPIKALLWGALSREKSKKYFFAGLFLLFGSFLLPYSIYYKIFASLLFLLSIVCLVKSSRPRPVLSS